MLISPSILAADYMNLEREIQEINQTDADRLHIDIMDGNFVPPISFGMDFFKAMGNVSSKPTDVHLMVDTPINFIDDAINFGANSIVFHIEADKHAHRTIGYIKSHDVKGGITINPATPICAIEPVLEICDVVLVMSVNPGYGGQAFIQNSLNKIQRLIELRTQHGYNYEIQVDGGINDLTIDSVKKAGADCVIAGSYVSGKDDYQSAISSLR